MHTATPYPSVGLSGHAHSPHHTTPQPDGSSPIHPPHSVSLTLTTTTLWRTHTIYVHTHIHSLCLLAQAYQVSAALVDEFARVEITVGFLMQVRREEMRGERTCQGDKTRRRQRGNTKQDEGQKRGAGTNWHTNYQTHAHTQQVDKLVQLLESPVFVLLRLQLLDAAQPFQPALLKSLYGAYGGTTTHTPS